MCKKIIIIILLIAFLFSISIVAQTITVNEHVKLGGNVVESSEGYRLIYTGWDTENLYFEVVNNNLQYQIIVPEAIKISMFELDIGVKIKIENIGKYLDIEVKRIK
jgi:hypothetical protein